MNAIYCDVILHLSFNTIKIKTKITIMTLITEELVEKICQQTQAAL